jgi:hypothetical protein
MWQRSNSRSRRAKGGVQRAGRSPARWGNCSNRPVDVHLTSVCRPSDDATRLPAHTPSRGAIRAGFSDRRLHTHSPTAVTVPQLNLASKVIVALRTLETGQFFSASPVIRANVAWSRFGTWARRVRADRLMRNPWPSGSSVTAASVSSSVGVLLALDLRARSGGRRGRPHSPSRRRKPKKKIRRRRARRRRHRLVKKTRARWRDTQIPRPLTVKLGSGISVCVDPLLCP